MSIIFIFTIWGCVSSAYPILLWWSRECVLYLIIIIKPGVWIINHCLGLGHETMVCAVCLTTFLCETFWLEVLFNCLHSMGFHEGHIATLTKYWIKRLWNSQTSRQHTREQGISSDSGWMWLRFPYLGFRYWKSNDITLRRIWRFLHSNAIENIAKFMTMSII